MAEWWQTVELEHQDRKNRLRRIATTMRLDPPPSFFDYTIPRSRLPAGFPVDMPVLRVVFPDRCFFDTAQTEILPRGLEILDVIAENLHGEPPDVTMFVAGHTDARGGDEYNNNLSVARADSVARALADHGVGNVAIWRVGFGESVPIASNDTPEGQALNRRVEFLFSGRLEPVAQWLAEQLNAPCYGANDNACRRAAPSRTVFEAVAVNSPAIVAPASVTETSAPLSSRRVRIDLGARMYSIPTPQR